MFGRPGAREESVEPVGNQTVPSALGDALGASYALERELGRGGMATVYRARDLRHGRSVAVKVLHPELAATLGGERFLREIELTATLQHPHILPLFDSGAAGGLLYYVMPFVEGETLRARLVRERQLPLTDAMRIATEVGDALAYAHACGVVHRDIKPENILLQGGPGGHALVADFGIGLAIAQADGARMTQTGLSVGTPQYMAPEQAMGERGVDARADLYALGAVLYEMLAGEPPFTGPTAQTIVARVMTETPRSLSIVRPSVPPHVDAAIRMALEKLPADRFPTATAFVAALSTPVLVAGGGSSGAEPRAPARYRRAGLVVLAVAGVLTAGVALGWVLRPAPAVGAGAGEAVRFTIEPDSGTLRLSAPAISPDGRTVVYAAEGADGARLYARRLEELTARPLAATEGGEWPFFSPDGEWLGFYADGAIRKVRLSGGLSSTVTDLPAATAFQGAAWGPDDVIYYAISAGGEGGTLHRVSAAGGTAAPVAVRDSATGGLSTPRPLPGGRAVLVTVWQRESGYAHLGALDLASGRIRPLGRGYAPRHVAGHLIYAGADGALYRQPFDVGRLAPTDAAEQIAGGVQFRDDMPSFDASPAGTLVHRVGIPAASASARMTLTDRSGRELRAIAARSPWAPRLSPDGRRLAFGAHAPRQDESDVWVADLEAGTTQRLTTDARDGNDPHWSPDGQSLVYSGFGAGTVKDLIVLPVGGGTARRLTSRPGIEWPSDWSPDGRTLLYTSASPGTPDIWLQPAHGGPPRPYLATSAAEFGARVSPDGRWVAYVSSETGRREVYVQSYPTPGRKTVVSAGGGTNPVWRGDGRELYYWRDYQLMAAAVEPDRTDGPLVVRSRAPLFRAGYVEGWHPNYDVSSDGTRFVLVTAGTLTNRLAVTLHALGTTGAARPGER
jgi:serine/threonine-protein kinase